MGFLNSLIKSFLVDKEDTSNDSGKNSFLQNLLLRPKLEYTKKDTDEIAKVRGVEIKRSEFDKVARPTIFGEVSNRPVDKKELESRVVLNTAINRMSEHKNRGNTAMLSDILSAPNQYQAYGGDQFNLYNTATNTLDVEKKKDIDTILDTIWGEMKTDKFKDITNNSFYYKHLDDGSIEYDDTRPLFK